MWPFNYITDLVYELAYGYLVKRKTHIYVSSGVGTWGPPLRIVADPEIADFRLNFKTHE
jgi:predicted MPP superfamily phosphohydrolase